MIVAAILLLVVAGALAALYWGARDPAPTLPAELVHPAPVVAHPRAGISVVEGGRVDLSVLGAGWYLNWTPRPAGRTGLEFLPVVCAYPDRNPIDAQRLAELRQLATRKRSSYPPGTTWIVGNEIGYRPQGDSRTPERHARDFHACRNVLKEVDPGFRVCLGPVIVSRAPEVLDGHVGGRSGVEYLAAVLDAYGSIFGTPLGPDCVSATAHVLEGEGTDEDVFQRQIVDHRRALAELGLSEVPLIVTEFGAVGRGADPATVERFLRGSIRFLQTARDADLGPSGDDGRLVQRWAWFTAHPVSTLHKLRHLGFAAYHFDIARSSLFDSAGRVTSLGLAYRRMVGDGGTVRSDGLRSTGLRRP